MSDPPPYRDRTDGYVPEPSYGDELQPQFLATIGPPTGARALVPVALGKPDELNRDPTSWWWAQISPASAGKEHWSKFSGWDIRISVQLDTWNWRDVNDWKGQDEVRKAGSWLLSFNDQPVYGDTVYGDAFATLERIARTARDLLSDRVQIDWRKGDYLAQLIGRPIYYRDTPARIRFWMPDQGCVSIEAIEGGPDFPPMAYDVDRRTGTDINPEHDYSEEWARDVKVELLSPDIWWHRSRPFGIEDQDTDVGRVWQDSFAARAIEFSQGSVEL